MYGIVGQSIELAIVYAPCDLKRVYWKTNTKKPSVVHTASTFLPPYNEPSNSNTLQLCSISVFIVGSRGLGLGSWLV